jgi:hypothetical protein
MTPAATLTLELSATIRELINSRHRNDEDG